MEHREEMSKVRKGESEMDPRAKLSPTEGEPAPSQDVQLDEQLIRRKVQSLCSVRYGIAFSVHICNFILMAQNVIMNITMVAMVNSTDHQAQVNVSTEGLPAHALGGPNQAPKSLPAEGAGLGGQFALWEKWSPPHERSRLCSIALSGFALGPSIVILLSGFICLVLGWPFAFYIFGAIGCICFLLWIGLVFDDPISHPWISISEKEYIISSLAQEVTSSRQPLPIKAMISSLPLWSMIFCCFGHQWLVIVLVIYTPTYISSVFNINIRDNGILSALPFLFAWVCSILAGLLADFLLTKNFRIVTVRKMATLVGNLPPSAFIVALPYLSSSYITTITLLILACGLSTFSQSGIHINALDIAPRHSSFLMGASRGFAHIAAILAPTVSGFLLNQDPEFAWRNVFLLLFAINTLCLIFYLLFGKADVQDWAKEKKLTRL
ncbi:sodium-dependent phosphate transport protein 4 isoform X3 [Echinops telfairi]|uniref:Sodium-dependent phosphate transport protein 4 isoform X3 n=1 Tax=Echinops telfairi TaxID=9371 RepID=A0AC55DIT7_ECHTE|nr:sodium-dependent phosphate transport protein 4 isoform X3 [Echinops telfairi]